MKKILIAICLLLPIAPSISSAQTVSNETLFNINQIILNPNTNHPFYELNKDSITIPSTEVVNPIEYVPIEYIEAKTITTQELLSKIERINTVYTVYDIESKKSFKATRYGGYNHLDAEPYTKEDTAVIKEISGFSWNRRAIIVEIDGEYYAASMHTMPHGNGHNALNNYDGHFCIHVIDSITHGTKRRCEKHMSMVAKAKEINVADLLK